MEGATSTAGVLRVGRTRSIFLRARHGHSKPPPEMMQQLGSMGGEASRDKQLDECSEELYRVAHLSAPPTGAHDSVVWPNRASVSPSLVRDVRLDRHRRSAAHDGCWATGADGGGAGVAAGTPRRTHSEPMPTSRRRNLANLGSATPGGTGGEARSP